MCSFVLSEHYQFRALQPSLLFCAFEKWSDARRKSSKIYDNSNNMWEPSCPKRTRRGFSEESHRLTVVYRHFLFVYNLYVGENYLVCHSKLDQRRFLWRQPSLMQGLTPTERARYSAFQARCLAQMRHRKRSTAQVKLVTKQGEYIENNDRYENRHE